jgi:hypothetical protein
MNVIDITGLLIRWNRLRCVAGASNHGGEENETKKKNNRKKKNDAQQSLSL